MKREFVTKVVAAAEDLGVNLEHYKDYSGRGMYGSKTDGIVGNMSDLILCVGHAAFKAGADGDEEFEEGLSDLQNLRMDNMACDMIIY